MATFHQSYRVPVVTRKPNLRHCRHPHFFPLVKNVQEWWSWLNHIHTSTWLFCISASHLQYIQPVQVYKLGYRLQHAGYLGKQKVLSKLSGKKKSWSNKSIASESIVNQWVHCCFSAVGLKSGMPPLWGMFLVVDSNHPKTLRSFTSHALGKSAKSLNERLGKVKAAAVLFESELRIPCAQSKLAVQPLQSSCYPYRCLTVSCYILFD